jgi:hypothetical protein
MDRLLVVGVLLEPVDVRLDRLLALEPSLERVERRVLRPGLGEVDEDLRDVVVAPDVAEARDGT